MTECLSGQGWKPRIAPSAATLPCSRGCRTESPRSASALLTAPPAPRGPASSDTGWQQGALHRHPSGSTRPVRRPRPGAAARAHSPLPAGLPGSLSGGPTVAANGRRSLAPANPHARAARVWNAQPAEMWLPRRSPHGPAHFGRGEPIAPDEASLLRADWWRALPPGSAPARLPSPREGDGGGGGAAGAGAAGAPWPGRRLARRLRASRRGGTRSCASPSRRAGSRRLAWPRWGGPAAPPVKNSSWCISSHTCVRRTYFSLLLYQRTSCTEPVWQYFLTPVSGN